MSELAKEICFILKDIPNSCSEDLYEQKVIQVLEKLGWSRFRNEIILKKKFRFGSIGTLIPDLIVKLISSNEKFVIEIKSPIVNIKNKHYQEQLFSYMRQLKINFGLLIGDKIQIFYDGKHNNEDNPILLSDINISPEDKDLSTFITYFIKSNFSLEKLENFAMKRIKQMAFEKNLKEIKKLLLSEEYKNKLKDFISRDLEDYLDKKTIKNISSNLDIILTLKIPPDNEPAGFPEDEKIAEIVRKNLHYIINYCKKNQSELEKLQSLEYSKDTLGIGFPFFKKVEKDSYRPNRYWKKKYEINNEYYVVTSEWYKKHRNKFEFYINKIKKSLS